MAIKFNDHRKIAKYRKKTYYVCVCVCSYAVKRMLKRATEEKAQGEIKICVRMNFLPSFNS